MKDNINIIEQKSFDEESFMNFMNFIQQKLKRLYHVEQEHQHREKQKFQHREKQKFQ